MKFGLKNDGGIELHLSRAERRELYQTLRECSANTPERQMSEDIRAMCELLRDSSEEFA